MRVLEQAAQIVEAGFAQPGGRLSLTRSGLSLPMTAGGVRGMNLTVRPGDPIRGALNWTNNDVDSGTILTGYILGLIDGELFYPVGLEHQGVEYLYGSRTSQAAPGKGATQTVYPTSWALGFQATVQLDAAVFVARGTLGTLTSDARIIGLNWNHFEALTFHGMRFFENVLTIDMTVPAQINSFSFTKQ